MRPLLSNLSGTSAIPVLSALRQMHRGYVEADRLMGSMCITGPIQLQMPVVERACEVARGADRAEMLRFGCQFMEFGGWLFQDAGDLICATHWTDRALDYALELGDQRIAAYTLMRKAMIATESGNPARGLGIANSALEYYVLANIVQEGNAQGKKIALFPSGEDWTEARRAAGLVSSSYEDMHAGELETSILLRAHPELVRDGYRAADWVADDRRHLLTTGMGEYTRSGVIGRPSLASPEKGKELLASLVDSFAPVLEILRRG